MKYGILTFHNIPNIGALLQAYSLCEAIKQQGGDCEIIDYKCDNIEKRELVYKPHSNILKDIVLRYLWIKTQKKIKKCQEYMMSKGLYSTLKYDSSNISFANQEYDAFISGSDMIWNLKVTDHDYTYFQNFVVDSKPKYSYGSSIGDKWENKDINKVNELLLRFNKISVREEDTCKFIQNLGIECKHVVDPTMLISSDNWMKEARPPKLNSYVLVYFSSKELVISARHYAKRHGLKVVLLSTGVPNIRIKNVFPFTPPEWLGYFLNADAVFTNSYHGLLFSLYFKKQVWCANYGNRIISLMDSLGLNNRLLKNDTELCSTIDFSIVEEKIEAMRQDSLEYLKSITSNT